MLARGQNHGLIAVGSAAVAATPVSSVDRTDHRRMLRTIASTGDRTLAAAAPSILDPEGHRRDASGRPRVDRGIAVARPTGRVSRGRSSVSDPIGRTSGTRRINRIAIGRTGAIGARLYARLDRSIARANR
jgi:hypothetical protein